MIIKKSDTKINKLWNISLQIIIVVLAWYFLYRQLVKKDGLDIVVDELSGMFYSNRSIPLLLSIFILMLCNWSVESLKWRYLLLKEERVSFLKSLKAVLTGISVSTFTPNRIGEFVGRVFVLRKTDAWRATFITILGSFSQLMVTILFGCAGMILFAFRFLDINAFNPYLFWAVVIFMVISTLIILFFYFNVAILESLLGKMIAKRWPKVARSLEVIKDYDNKQLFITLLLSTLRYTIFTLQFFLLLKLFDVQVTLITSCIITAVMFFIMSIIPTIALSELGMRGSISIYLFAFYFTESEFTGTLSAAIVATSTLLWLINLAIPAIAGTFFVYQLRFFRRKNSV